MQITPITYNTKTNISHKGFAQDVKKLSLFATDHRLSLLEKKEIRGIDKPKNLKLVDELFKVFEGCFGSDIYRAYYAILDSNDEVNNYAKSALYALASGKSTSILTNLKNIGKQGSKSYKLGLDHIADLIQACKDDKGNHNKKALDLLGELETETLDPIKIPTYIEFCKDKDGLIDDKKVKLLKDFISKGYHIHAGVIAQLPEKISKEVTQARLQLFNHVMEKYKNNEIKPDGLTLLQELLEGCFTDNTVQWFDERFDDLLNKDKTVRWGAEYFKDNLGNIPWRNVHLMLGHVIPELKLWKISGAFPPNLLKNDLGNITFGNFDDYMKLVIKYGNDFISEISKIKEFKNADGTINDKFINFTKKAPLNLKKEYSSDMLREILRISTIEDKSIDYKRIDWEIAESISKPINLLFEKVWNDIERMGLADSSKDIKKGFYNEAYFLCSRIEKIIKNNGKFSKKRIEQINEIANDKNGTELLIKALSGKTLTKTVEGKNLYRADELLEVLEKLNNFNNLNRNSINSPIKDFDNLFWAIIEAPRTEENKETYSKVMELFSKVKGLDFNQKDKNGISVLEKVINAENEELLDVIIKNSDELYYYPELDWGVNGIQNQAFKEKIKNLDLKFKDLEQSAQLCSVKTFDRLKPQLDSPLCDKAKVIENLFNIVKEQKGTIEPPDVYVYHLLDEYGDCLPKGLFDEMARWQIVERNRRMMK